MAFLRSMITAAGGVFGVIGVRLGPCGIISPSFGVRGTDLSRGRTEPAYAKELVGGSRKVGGKRGASNTLQAAFAQTAYGFELAEDLLDPLAASLRTGIAGMARGAAIEPRGRAVADAGDVRGDAAPAQPGDEVFRVVAAVGTHRLWSDLLAGLAPQKI